MLTWSSLSKPTNAATYVDVGSEHLIGDSIHSSFLEEGFWGMGAFSIWNLDIVYDKQACFSDVKFDL